MLDLEPTAIGYRILEIIIGGLQMTVDDYIDANVLLSDRVFQIPYNNQRQHSRTVRLG